PRGRGNRVAHAEIQVGATVRPEPATREGDVVATVPGLRAEQRTAHASSRFPAATDRAGMVRRGQCQVALPDPRPGRSVPRQISSALVPHIEGRNDRRRDEVERDCGYPHAVEVVHRARHPRWRPAQGAWRGDDLIAKGSASEFWDRTWDIPTCDIVSASM